MSNESGPPPWNHEQYWRWRAGFKRVNRRTAEKAGVEHSLSSGYRAAWSKRPDDFKTKKVRLYNGRTVEVPDADYEDYIGHRATPHEPLSEIGDYIYNAFDSGLRPYQTVDGVGHIHYMEYSPMYQLLRVEFVSDGAVVVFFRVPKEVYSELKMLAESGATMPGVDGKPRHLLGMRFWDIIRIRGQREGSRYKYEYVIQGERKGSQFAQDIAIERKVGDEQLYDRYAVNFLTGQQRNAYNALDTIEQKEQFLHKAGII